MDNRQEMPIGFSFQLGMSEKAMAVYAGMKEEEKQQVIAAARNASSKAEVQQLVAGLERNFM